MMHYHRSRDFIRTAIDEYCKRPKVAYGKDYVLPWLFGYTSHVMTDLTIHPVVERTVGKYSVKKNRRPHRICELNQDAYVFPEIMEQQLVKAEQISVAGIATCCFSGNRYALNPDLKEFWHTVLLRIVNEMKCVDAALPQKGDMPDIDKWFRRFVLLTDKIAEEAGEYLARLSVPIFTNWLGIAYPNNASEVKLEYVKDLNVPGNQKMDILEVFYKGRGKGIDAWNQASDAIIACNPLLFSVPNGNLDTGEDENNTLICWDI